MLGCIGHVCFVVLHVLAILFGVIGLLITVPLHLIFAAILAKK